ncbi:MAG TPA: AAA family ATPase, partial [Blastocatellia bacterium]
GPVTLDRNDLETGGSYDARQRVPEYSNNGKMIRAWASHSTAEGGSTGFDLKHESDGTLRLMRLAPILFRMRGSESIFIIDELELRLHPLLCKMFVETALSNGTWPNSQIIFTTHNTDLLDDVMRRDEIWLVEKDKEGASHLRSLAEFDIRPDLKIRRGYLNGRFGAIPMLRELPEGGDAKSGDAL